MLFASWYLRVNLTFPMNSKLEQRFDKMRQGRDKVTCRTFICLSIQQIFEGRLLRASPVLRHNTGQGMWPRDRALALHSSAEGFLRMSSLLSFNSVIPLSWVVRTNMMDLELSSDWWELSSLSERQLKQFKSSLHGKRLFLYLHTTCGYYCGLR